MRMVAESGETGVPRKIRKKLNLIKLLFGKKDKTSLSDTIVDFVEENESEKIGVEEKEILLNAVNFTDTIVEDVMVPRSDITAFNLDSNLTELINTFLTKRYTRIPLFVENLDNIKGFIHIKDILPYFSEANEISIDKLMRKALFIPPSMKIVDLAYKMRNTGVRLAIVVDEYGGTDGLITMEDLMDEIVGEVEENEIISLNNNLFEVSARTRIIDIEEKLQLKLYPHDKEEEDFDTLGGLVASISQKIPKSGEIIEHQNGIKFHIKDAASRYIKKVIIELPKHE